MHQECFILAIFLKEDLKMPPGLSAITNLKKRLVLLVLGTRILSLYSILG